MPSVIDNIYIDFSQPGMSLQKAQEAIAEYKEIKTRNILLFYPDSSRAIIELNDNLDCRTINQLLRALNADPRLHYATPKLVFPNGFFMILTDEISALPKEGADSTVWEAQVSELGLIVKDRFGFGNRIVVPDMVDGYESITKAKELFEKGTSKWASPNAYSEIVLHTK